MLNRDNLTLDYPLDNLTVKTRSKGPLPSDKRREGRGFYGRVIFGHKCSLHGIWRINKVSSTLVRLKNPAFLLLPEMILWPYIQSGTKQVMWFQCSLFKRLPTLLNNTLGTLSHKCLGFFGIISKKEGMYYVCTFIWSLEDCYTFLIPNDWLLTSWNWKMRVNKLQKMSSFWSFLRSPILFSSKHCKDGWIKGKIMPILFYSGYMDPYGRLWM